MTKKADTWMPWYVADYLSDTAHLTTEQHGAYCLMLMAAWKAGGSLPNDDGQLTAVCRLTPAKWKASKAILTAFFKQEGNRIVHKRVTAEREKAQQISDKKAKNGKEGASKRWQSDGKEDGKAMANATPKPSQNDAPSPSPSPSERSVAKATGGEPPISDQDTIFGYGVPLLVNAGTPEKQARSFLGKLRSGYQDSEIVDVLRACVKAKAVQPLEYLAKALPPQDAPKNIPWHESRSGVEAKAAAVGIGPWDEINEQWPAYKARVMATAALKKAA